MLAQIYHFYSVIDAPNRIRELRMARGLSQQAVAEAIGVSKVTISDLERGEMHLTVDYMRRLAPVLAVVPADLLGPADNPGGLTAEERHLIEQLRHASRDQREQLQRVADVIAPWDEQDERAA